MDGQREELRGAVHRGERVHKVNAGLSLVNDLSTPLLLVNTVIILSLVKLFIVSSHWSILSIFYSD